MGIRNELSTFAQAIAQAALHHGHVPRRMNPPDSDLLVQNLRNLESGRNLLPQGPGRQQFTKDFSKARRQLQRSRASAKVRKAASSGAVDAWHRSSPPRIPEKLLCTEGKETWATEATDHFSCIFADESQERAEWSSRVEHQLSDHTFDMHISAEEVKQSILSFKPRKPCAADHVVGEMLHALNETSLAILTEAFTTRATGCTEAPSAWH